MLCDICHKRDATVHFTWIEGDRRTKLDACTVCFPPTLSEEERGKRMQKLFEEHRRKAAPPMGGPDQQIDRFSAAIKRFDEENSRDPNLETVGDVEHAHDPVRAQPRELLYAKWLTDWVLKLDPGASEELRLAARCQHICRWMIPRESYPMTRAGYLKWRQDLKEFHAKKAGEILTEVGYPPHTVERVQALNLKRHLAADAEVQTLEDALCLVFLEHQLGPLLEKTAEEKVITALQKSWAKMSPRGREAALGLSLPPREREIVRKSLEGS